MSYEYTYKGHDVDIDKSYDEVYVYGVHNGRVQKITFSSLSDMEVMHAVLGEILARQYAEAEIQAPVDYVQEEGC